MPSAEMMRAAIEVAIEGVEEGQTPFGALIAREGELIVSSHNLVWSATDITAHAEVVAIREACRRLGAISLAGCEIYSTCEPCPMCFAACHWAALDRIVFGTRIEDARHYGFRELTISNREMKRMGGSKIELVEDFLREECLEPFRLWAARKDRRTY